MRHLEELHRLAIRYPLPEYEGAMAKVVSSRSKYNSCLRHNLRYFYLRALVGILRPRRVLDLSYGLSASFMMTTLPSDSTLFCVRTADSRQASEGDHLSVWDGDPRLIRITADPIGPEILARCDITDIDLLFLDDGNMFCLSMEKLAAWLPEMASEAVIAMGDIHSHDGFDWFWEWINLPKLDLGSDIHPNGFGLISGNSRYTLEAVPVFPGFTWRG
jgi:hypothetical protein